jgi:hypothetical protein
MIFVRPTLTWWYWLLTAIALGTGVVGWGGGVPIAMVLTAAQGIHLGFRARSMSALSLQMKSSYLGMLFLGSRLHVPAIHWVQFVQGSILEALDALHGGRAQYW